jgi:hypothetical protein
MQRRAQGMANKRMEAPGQPRGRSWARTGGLPQWLGIMFPNDILLQVTEVIK